MPLGVGELAKKGSECIDLYNVIRLGIHAFSLYNEGLHPGLLLVVSTAIDSIQFLGHYCSV